MVEIDIAAIPGPHHFVLFILLPTAATYKLYFFLYPFTSFGGKTVSCTFLSRVYHTLSSSVYDLNNFTILKCIQYPTT